MLIPLSDATSARCGGKAAALAVLLREGLPVPDGFVVPFGARAGLGEAVARELQRMGRPTVVVRSSAADEDTMGGSAAGQYESVIGVQDAADVCEAIAACRESAHSARVAHYRNRTGGDTPRRAPEMAVLVQLLVDADVSGVMFTPRAVGDSTRIEASWGLGQSVVGGAVTPDAYAVAADGTVGCLIGRKDTRVDVSPKGSGVAVGTVDEELRSVRALEDDVVVTLAELGHRIAAVLGHPQDVEWAISGGAVWIVQARPITAPLPSARPSGAPGTRPRSDGSVLSGTPGSGGVVTAYARVVRGPSDFPRVRPGEVVICPHTDPAWTPLFTLAAGVVTETGGVLSHAAIVAREYGIPAVLGVADAMTRIHDGDRLILDGTTGTVTSS